MQLQDMLHVLVLAITWRVHPERSTSAACWAAYSRQVVSTEWARLVRTRRAACHVLDWWCHGCALWTANDTICHAHDWRSTSARFPQA